MDLVSIISVASGLVTIAEPIISWVLGKDGKVKQTKIDLQKAYNDYKVELNSNWKFLSKVELAKIDTKDITNPSIKDFAARLQTNAASVLLETLYGLVQKPEKAAKALKGKTLTAEEKAEAKKLIKTIISVYESTKELQLFTGLSEAERKILKGFYARARIKNIKEKTLYIKQQIIGK